MRTIGAWLLAAATILFSVIISEQIVSEQTVLGTHPQRWVTVGVGVVGGVVAVLVAVTAGAAGAPSPRDAPDPPLEPALLERRLAARLIDIAVLALPLFFAFVMAATVAILSSEGADPPSVGVFLLVLLVAMSLLPIMLYEVALTARSGRTFGKDALSIMVVRHDDGQLPAAAAAFIRWFVPAVASVAGAVVVAMIPVPEPQGLARLVGPAAGGFVAWLLVYASSIWDTDRRGWHDKAAGTVVVNEPEPHARPTQPKQAARKSGAGVAEAVGLGRDRRPLLDMRRGEQVSPANFIPATPAQHVLARFIDLALIAAALFTAMIAGFLSLPSGWLFGPDTPRTSAQNAYLIAAIAIAVGAVTYELAATAWRGRTLGLRIVGIQVLRQDNGHVPSLIRAIIRWTIPYLVLIAGGAAETVSSEPMALFTASWIVGGVLWWLLIPASSAWTPNHRDGTTKPPAPSSWHHRDRPLRAHTSIHGAIPSPQPSKPLATNTEVRGDPVVSPG